MKPRVYRHLASSILASVLIGCIPSWYERSDDQLEPNNSFSQATQLTAGAIYHARANQGDADFFRIDITDMIPLNVKISDRGLEHCPTLSVYSADRTLLHRSKVSCSGAKIEDEITRTGITLKRVGNDYQLTIVPTSSDTYYLSIVEGGQADNVLPFSWDYSVTLESTQKH